MRKRRALSYADHLRLGELLWTGGELACELYDVARKRCRMGELRPLERLFCTPGVFDIVRSLLDDAVFEDARSWPTRPDSLTLGAVYYHVSERAGRPPYHFSPVNYGRRQPLTDEEWTRIDTLLCTLRASAHDAWRLAVQRLTVAALTPLEKVWRSTGTLSKLALLFERKVWEDTYQQRAFGNVA